MSRHSNIDVRYNTPGTKELVQELKPDTVIIATGSNPIIPKIPGIDKPNVRIAATYAERVQEQPSPKLSLHPT